MPGAASVAMLVCTGDVMGELHGRCHHVSVCASDLDLVHPHSTPNRVEFIGPTRSPRIVRMEEGR